MNSLGNPRDTARDTEGDSQFEPIEREPTTRDIRVMIALAVATSVVTCMGNHYYSFGGNLMKQMDGGSTGSDLTGEVSRNVIADWDLTFMSI